MIFDAGATQVICYYNSLSFGKNLPL